MAKIGLLLFVLAIVLSSAVCQDCTSPLVTGRCRGGFQSYGFDTRTGKCEEFTYGGCGGNGNRYQTLAACQKSCEGKPSYNKIY